MTDRFRGRAGDMAGGQEVYRSAPEEATKSRALRECGPPQDVVILLQTVDSQVSLECMCKGVDD